MVFPSRTAQPDVQVATAGEALFDLIEEPDGRLRPCAGGAVYNLTRALGLQGVGTLYLNPLSADRLGRQLAQGLRAAAVALAVPEPVALPTSLALAALDGAGKASYGFYRDGVADRAITAQALNAACA
ncbi:carbohydrate kinase, partial [Verminephrobacter sp. Larva24]